MSAENSSGKAAGARIQRALESATETRMFWLGEDMLSRTPEMFKSLFPGRAACLVASRVGGASWVSSLLGAAEALAVLSVAVALSRVVFGTSGVGGGDVKLISALGLCFGAEWTPVLIMLTSAFVVATGLFLRGRRGSEESARLAVPAAPAITIAVVVTFSLAFRVKQL